MFGKRKKERTMSMIQSYKPTSKATLKQYCLLVAQGNVDEATKLYDYFIADMEDLPMFDPVPPSWIDSTRNAVNGITELISENKDGLAQAYEIFRGIMAARGKNLPALAKTAETIVEPLENIN
jgi:hypothetical protein